MNDAHNLPFPCRSVCPVLHRWVEAGMEQFEENPLLIKCTQLSVYYSSIRPRPWRKGVGGKLGNMRSEATQVSQNRMRGGRGHTRG